MLDDADEKRQSDRERRPLRAVVTPWNVRCGVAEYSRYLLEALGPDASEWLVLAPTEAPTVGHDGPTVLRTWPRAGADLGRTLDAISRLDAEFVHFQYEPSLFSIEVLGAAVTALKDNGRRVAVTFHAVDLPWPEPARLALRRADRIYVHSRPDLQQLDAVGLSESGALFHHGFPSPAGCSAEAAREELGLGQGPIVTTCGFLADHKGLLELIEAVSILRVRHPAARLVAFAPYHPFADSRQVHENCVCRIFELDLEESCHIVTRWLAPDQLVRCLAASDVVVLPYQEVVHTGSSAAVRMALASGRPVVAPAMPMFADVCDVVFSPLDRSPGALADAADRLLADPDLRYQLADRARSHGASRVWPEVARRYRLDVAALCGRPADGQGTPWALPSAPRIDLSEVKHDLGLPLPIAEMARNRLRRLRDPSPRRVIENLHREVAGRDEQIAWLHREVAERDDKITWLHREVAGREGLIAALTSRRWLPPSILRRLRDALRPGSSVDR